jgi:multisubunit Na+/H+ antiporter MnhB subunit
MNGIVFIGSLGCLLAAAVVLVRALPAQNAAFIILLLALVEVALEHFAPGGELQQGAMFWPGAIILSRTVGQHLLKPWRRSRFYGLYLIGLTSCAAAVLQLRFDTTQTALGRFCATAICLIFLMPWFLQKRVTASGESKK